MWFKLNRTFYFLFMQKALGAKIMKLMCSSSSFSAKRRAKSLSEIWFSAASWSIHDFFIALHRLCADGRSFLIRSFLTHKCDLFIFHMEYPRSENFFAANFREMKSRTKRAAAPETCSISSSQSRVSLSDSKSYQNTQLLLVPFSIFHAFALFRFPHCRRRDEQ
jgi:hypothetical protein